MNDERRSFLKKTMAIATATTVSSISKAGTKTEPEQKDVELKVRDISEEIKRTKSDFTIYVPKSADGSTADNGNEHFLVSPCPDGSLMAIWTQSTTEAHGDHRIMFSKSTDKGRTWAEPKFLVGVRAGQGLPLKVSTGGWVRPDCSKVPNVNLMASWGFPLVSKSGRIYVVYNKYQGVKDVQYAMTGTMDAIYSDDYGKTWSKPQTIPMKRSIWDHPDTSIPSNWIVWQLPHLDLKDRWYVGFTRWISPAVYPSRNDIRPLKPLHWRPAVIEFMRYENIDDNPQPKDIKISWFASDNKAIKVPHPDLPIVSLTEEPSITRLPDNRLFCTMRTLTNYIWYTLSEDDGETWSDARPLLYQDHGMPIISPIFCTPIYRLPDGRYILIHHPGYKTPELKKKYNVDDKYNRRPALITLGEYRPHADQPIWFSKSKLFMDNNGVGIGPAGRLDTGGYGSLTSIDGETVYWHPDRKFFLLGKIITDDLLSDLEVPKSI